LEEATRNDTGWRKEPGIGGWGKQQGLIMVERSNRE
jgi:hypothetical protein